MKIEKLTENKIRIIMSQEDLENQNIDLIERLNNQQEEIDALKTSTTTSIANLTREIDALKETVGNISNTVDRINGEVI